MSNLLGDIPADPKMKEAIAHDPAQPVLMHDETIMPVQDIRDGDHVMGPDSKPRLVGGVTRGHDEPIRSMVAAAADALWQRLAEECLISVKKVIIADAMRAACAAVATECASPTLPAECDDGPCPHATSFDCEDGRRRQLVAALAAPLGSSVAITAKLDLYLTLERAMLAVDGTDGAMADRIRDLMDPVWRGLNDQERTVLDARGARGHESR